MSQWIWRGSILLAMAVGGGLVGGQWYSQRLQTLGKTDLRMIGQTTNFRHAQQILTQLETPPGVDDQISALVDHWSTGDRQYDLHLARHVAHRASGEPLRKQFSREFAQRPELLARWAQFWAWRAGSDPTAAAAQRLDELDQSLRGGTSPLTWRDVLDLQALMELSGARELALDLEPANLPDRLGRWRAERTGSPLALTRPQRPLPESRGPVVSAQLSTLP